VANNKNPNQRQPGEKEPGTFHYNPGNMSGKTGDKDKGETRQSSEPGPERNDRKEQDQNHDSKP
jgi:hypothetical protein